MRSPDRPEKSKVLGIEFIRGLGSGSLEPSLALFVSAYAAMRADAADDLADLETAGGVLLEAETPAPLSDDALSRALDAIDAIENCADVEGVSRARRAIRQASGYLVELGALPEVVRNAAYAALETTPWKFAGPGVRILPLGLPGKAKAELLRIEPGHGAPRHGHLGCELTLVLTGAFLDEHGRFGPGDVSIAGADLEHRPIAEPGPVCYALAVTDAPLAFKGLLGVFQRTFLH